MRIALIRHVILFVSPHRCHAVCSVYSNSYVPSAEFAFAVSQISQAVQSIAP
jgi:hypothetical protein